jgi:hypothetical protein
MAWMSEAEQPVTGSALSFERAEFENQASPALACAFCRKPIVSQYWQISKRAGCAECRLRLQQELAGSNSSAHFLGALRLGALAALAGSVGWIVVSKVTGYEVGIVAIGVGWLVGRAVRKGAGGFGGTRYQVMAMLLTYSAIAFASLPAIFEALRQSPKHGAAAAASQVGLGPMIWAWAMLLGIAFASPFLAGPGNFMGWIIIAIGLYEAWKFTRAVPVQVLGPFAIEAVRVPRAPAPDAAD